MSKVLMVLTSHNMLGRPEERRAGQPDARDDAVQGRQAAQAVLASTVKLDQMRQSDFDTAFYPGGHGPMWDRAESPVSIALIESFYDAGKPIALVCHAPGVLRHAKHRGEPLVKGKRVTGFTNDEEEEVQLTRALSVRGP